MSIPLSPSPMCNPLVKMEIRFDGTTGDGRLRTVNGARFGMVRNGGRTPHQGVDLHALPGTPVFSVADGEIVRIRLHDPKYGKEVMLRFVPTASVASRFGLSHDAAIFVVYAHLSRIDVAYGSSVRMGQVIGATGTSGNADQKYPHLHFELRTQKDAGLRLWHRLNPETIFFGIDYSRPIEVLDRLRSTA